MATDRGTKTWFITGASTGFGKAIAMDVLQGGRRVIPTARNIDTVGDIAAEGGDRVLPLALDVKDRRQIATRLRQRRILAVSTCC